MSTAVWGGSVAVLVALALILGYRLLRRDSAIRRTRWGFFVERDRYQDDDGDERPAEETQEWPRRDEP